MKKWITFCASALLLNVGFAQGVTIGSNNPPDPTAVLDIQSTSKGFLLPRMTTQDRNAIVSPAHGLEIYNTTVNCYQVYMPLSGWRDVICDCPNPPSSAFTFPDPSGISSNVNFSATQGGLTYNWTFQGGNPGSSTSQTPTVQWSNIGNYVVTLTVTDNIGCSSTTVDTAHIINCPAGSQTFAFTGGTQTFTVPGCVTQITVDGYGAQGGIGGTSSSGGLGGRVQATLTVTPGEVLQVVVGGAGANNITAGFNGGGTGGSSITPHTLHGGGGGGATDIRRTPYALGDRLLVAGGGGGAGGPQQGGGGGGGGGGYYGGGGGGFSLNCCTNTPATAGVIGVGGNGGHHVSGCSCSSGTGGGFGGAGGGLTGGIGGEVNTNSGDGGLGGTQGAGGAAGLAGSTCSCSNDSNGGGGGGGSSYVTVVGSSNITHTQGVRSGNGTITINW